MDRDHAQAVPQRLMDGHDQPIPDEQYGDGRVQEGPEPPRDDAACHIRARELMHEAQRSAQIGQQMQGPPRLVGDPAAYRTSAAHTDGDEQGRTGERGRDGRVSEEGHDGGDEVGAGVGGVSAHGEDQMGRAQHQDVPSTGGVTAGEAVGADSVLDRGDARHEEEHDEDAVSGEQSGEVCAGREERVEPCRRFGLYGPEGADADAAHDDARAQGARRDAEGSGGTADAGAAGGPRRYGRVLRAWALDVAQIRVQGGVPGELGFAGGLGRHAATVGV